MDIKTLMLEEIKKPPGERNVLPMVATYCPGCTMDCALPDCPLIRVKWLGEYVEAPVAAVKETARPAPATTVYPAPGKGTKRSQQPSLF